MAYQLQVEKFIPKPGRSPVCMITVQRNAVLTALVTIDGRVSVHAYPGADLEISHCGGPWSEPKAPSSPTALGVRVYTAKKGVEFTARDAGKSYARVYRNGAVIVGAGDTGEPLFDLVETRGPVRDLMNERQVNRDGKSD